MAVDKERLSKCYVNSSEEDSSEMSSCKNPKPRLKSLRLTDQIKKHGDGDPENPPYYCNCCLTLFDTYCRVFAAHCRLLLFPFGSQTKKSDSHSLQTVHPPLREAPVLTVCSEASATLPPFIFLISWCGGQLSCVLGALGPISPCE